MNPYLNEKIFYSKHVVKKKLPYFWIFQFMKLLGGGGVRKAKFTIKAQSNLTSRLQYFSFFFHSSCVNF